jgi:hypothetical protein
MNGKNLQKDIEHVLETGEGWSDEIAKWVSNDARWSLNSQIGPEKRRKNLRFSNVGSPCDRKIWYEVASDLEPEPLKYYEKNKFIFGNLIESYVIGLVMASGHKVEGLQDQLSILGVKGHRDLVIDGVTFDVKSCSTFAFNKYKNGGLLKDDRFGYLSQLSSYVYAARNDPIVTDKAKGGFIFFDKQFGKINVEIYDLSDWIKEKENEVQHRIDVVKGDIPPRGFEDVPQYEKSPNRKLCPQCSYCGFKKHCWPELRTFIYNGGPQYLTKVVKEPKVWEVKDET